MAYTTVADVKVILQIPAEDESYDTELEGCVESADAVVESWLLRDSLDMPSPVPRNLKDCSTYLGAWLFRRRRNYEESTASFWTEGNPRIQDQNLTAAALRPNLDSSQKILTNA